ncbi:MAG: hypothetical protein ACKVXR_06795 [Planctomycetota bacterium]
MRKCLLLLVLSLGACRTTTSQVPDPSTVSVARAVPVRAWELWQEGLLLGSLVRFEETGDGGRAFYSVRNREGQEMGLIDIDGRIWRHRQHERRPEWLGTGTVEEGSERILGGSEKAELIEVDLERLREVLERFN